MGYLFDDKRRRSGWIGGEPDRWEIDRKAEEQRQIDQVRDEGAERWKRRNEAAERLSKAREQLLAFSIVMYQRARTEELNGNYELMELILEYAQMVRDICANQTVERLKDVK